VEELQVMNTDNMRSSVSPPLVVHALLPKEACCSLTHLFLNILEMKHPCYGFGCGW